MRFFIVLMFVFNAIFGASFDLDDLKNIARDNIGGEWIQDKQLLHFDNVIKSSGRFKIINKELFWEIQTPIQNEIKLNGKHLFVKQNNQWVIADKQYDKDIFLDIVNLNVKNIKNNFDLNLSGSKQQWTIELLPKNIILKKIFKSIKISGGKYVQTMILYESNGDITTNTFYNISENQ